MSLQNKSIHPDGPQQSVSTEISTPEMLAQEERRGKPQRSSCWEMAQGWHKQRTERWAFLEEAVILHAYI